MTTVDQHTTTTESVEQFAQRIVGAIDSASVAILLSIGHQTGLFDVLPTRSSPRRA